MVGMVRGQTDRALVPICNDAAAAALKGSGGCKIGCGGGGQGRRRRRWSGDVSRWHGRGWRCHPLVWRRRRTRRRASLCRRGRSNLIRRSHLFRNGVFSRLFILQIQTFAVTISVFTLSTPSISFGLLLPFLLFSRFLCLVNPLRRFDDRRHRTAFHGGESRCLRSRNLLLRGRRRSQQRRLWRRPRRGRSFGTESGDGGAGSRGARGDERELRRLRRMGQRWHWRHQRK